jgi:opacity protein-like surface antigen
MSRRRLTILWAVAFAAALPARDAALAQRSSEPGPFHVLVLTTGMSRMSVEALNARTTAANFAPLSDDAVSYGASGHVAFGRALLGAEVHRSTFGEEGLNNGRTDDLSTMQGLATASYVLVTAGRLSVYPQLGVGLGRVEVALRDRSGSQSASASQPTFDEVAAAPGIESRLTGRHLLYSFGGGADFLVGRRGSTIGVVLGVRAGVLASPNRTTWTRDGQTVVAGPDAAAGGPFLRIVVGVGGR